MTDVWPLTLPQQLMADGQQAVGDPRIRSQTDAGPAKVRPRFSAVVDPLAGSMRMNTGQWVILRSFGTTTLLRWSLPFLFPDPDGGVAPLLVRFSSNLPDRKYVTVDLWQVSLSLEVLP